MYDPIYSNLATFAQVSRMKDRCACGDEHFVFNGATYHVSVGPNEAVVSDDQGMAPRAPENCIFQNDALSSDGNGPTLSDDLRTVHDAATRTDCDVANHNCIGCYPCRRIDLRRNAVMFDEQVVLLVGV